ncbi:hypothetical protein GW813_05215 [bacterium]|nr:hypothetical protein [bacterium]PIV80314.1 MAG: hypothetical protein COW53_10390 [bacterium CG17_big_fil_post_rev_8_21_14_2_50_64_8]PJA77139.1 MAG: hypothetical protein CO151_00480 [bacterium CG_4_9_14_3_um_filter_65_15]
MLHSQVDLQRLGELQVSAADEESAVESQQTALRSYEHRLRELIEICRSSGITPIFATQPALYGDGIDEPTGVDLGRIKMGEHINGHLKWEILQMYNRATEEVAADSSCLRIVLGDRMPKSSRYFYDYHHFNNAGCARVADIVAEELTPYLKARALDLEQASGHDPR